MSFGNINMKNGGDSEAHTLPFAFVQARTILEKSLFNLFVTVGEMLVRAYSLALYGDEEVLDREWKGGETLSKK